MKLVAVFLSMIATYFLTASQAYAAAVLNLDDKPHFIQVLIGGEPVAYEIKPGRSFRLIGMAKVRYNGREVTIDHNEEYAIWKDGTFGIQMHTGRTGTNN